MGIHLSELGHYQNITAVQPVPENRVTTRVPTTKAREALTTRVGRINNGVAISEVSGLNGLGDLVQVIY